jgi:arylsulfatase A-like enzyme
MDSHDRVRHRRKDHNGAIDIEPEGAEMTEATGPLGDERWFTSRATGRPAARPDLLFIFADDLGWADLGCFGSIEIATPVEPDADHPLDGPSLLPYLVDGVDYPEHDLRWRTTSQVAMGRGDLKYLHDRRPRPRLGAWPVSEGDYHLLYDVTVDGREKADLAPHHPELVAELRAEAGAVRRRDAPVPTAHARPAPARIARPSSRGPRR